MLLTKHNIQSFDEWKSLVEHEGGVALIDKDVDWTSFDVVAKMRSLAKIKKVGHAGTLDPLATGLLILCFGKATKSIETYQAQEKRYTALIRLGATTKTDDAEFDEENICSTDHLSKSEIESAVMSFLGEISQIPPMFSAKKVKGKRLYELARKNIEIELKPSIVNIYDIKILSINLPYVELDIQCSKGTYIRSLARDIGNKLSVGAYLKSLRRTAIGSFNVDDAFKIQELVEFLTVNNNS